MVEVEVDGHKVEIAGDAWDRLRGQAPVSSTFEDKTDHALGMIGFVVRFSDRDLLARYDATEVESGEVDALADQIERCD